MTLVPYESHNGVLLIGGSDIDEKCHLFGATRILNSISAFAADGGLRESASWISLRQHIYISLTSQQPLTINLTNYRHSNVFRTGNDEAWANRIIFIFANILTHVFLPDGQPLTVEEWTDFETEVSAWNIAKPWHFAPFFSVSSTPASKSAGEHIWPEFFMLNAAQGISASQKLASTCPPD